jgi:hypothetical protein
VLEPLILKGSSLRQACTKVYIHGLQTASDEAKEVFRFHQIPGNHSSPE